MATRTMETEVEIPNPDLRLVPGMYATVNLHVQKRKGALAIPVEGVASRSDPTVYLVAKDGLVSERRVKLGVETPNWIEILGGLSEGDLVIVGSREAVHPGETVETKLMAPSNSL